MNTIILLASVLAAATTASAKILDQGKPAGRQGTFELLILHNNDMHARFEQTSQLSGTCTTSDAEGGKCYGGFARVAHVVKEARKAAAEGRGPPVLYLNAGDTYTGTAWFTLYKWKIAAEFINALQPDAVALGNNELKSGSNKLSPFLDNLKTTILASNVIVKSEDGNQKMQKSVIIDVEGVKVGLVGYLRPDTNLLDSTGNIEYIDEVIALKDEVAKLQKQNVNIIIALGHADNNKDIEIAKEVEGINIVIGGHKNVYFWNGTNADKQFTDGNNPIVVTQQSGKQVLVVQSYAYNKYLGQIHANFDSNGEMTTYTVQPILLDEKIPQDSDTVKIAEEYIKEIASRNEEVLGETAVVLDGESCKLEECNLGNLIADAMMYYYALRFEGDNWTDAPVAIIPGGEIAASISPSNRPASVTRGDLLSALPKESHIVAVTMNGAVLLQLLEHSISSYSISNPSGQLLQFSGIRVVYDLARESGSRVLSAVVRCWNCYVPEFYTIDDWRTYKILMPASLADGAYGYSMLVDQPREDLVYDEVTCTAEFIGLRSPVYPEVAGRIDIINVGDGDGDGDGDEDGDGDGDGDSDSDGDGDGDGGSDSDSDEDDSATALSSTVFILSVALIPFII